MDKGQLESPAAYSDKLSQEMFFM